MRVTAQLIQQGTSGLGTTQGNPEWFDRLSLRAQQFYLSRHPSSRFKISKTADPHAPNEDQQEPIHNKPHHDKMSNSIVRYFQNARIEDLRAKAKKKIHSKDEEDLMDLVHGNSDDKPISENHTKEDIADDEAKHESKLSKLGRIPEAAVHIIKRILLGVLIAVGLAATVAVTHPALATHACLFAYANFTHGEPLIPTIWRKLTVLPSGESVSDVFVNTLHEVFSGDRLHDHNLSQLVAQHRE